jgi:hypothetical protein
MTIPIGITARNEARNILALLRSLRESAENAAAATGCAFTLHLLLNDNQDDTPRLVAAERDLTVWHTAGGIVAAQRAFAERFNEHAPFLIFSDADILVHRDAVAEITRAMLDDPALRVAYAVKYPIEPVRRTWLARALYLYNLREGYQTHRHYFNGQLFAIRRWHIPEVRELSWDARRDNGFLNLGAGIRCDDIYLSREALRSAGPGAIRCLPSGIQYRPPETLVGMYRKYQRMVLEIERLDCYFPRTVEVHRRWGRRRLDRAKLAAAPLGEQLHYALFQAALLLCKAAYAVERIRYTHFSSRPCPTWLPVTETKERMP